MSVKCFWLRLQFLNKNDKNYVELDISIICDKIRLQIKAATVLQIGGLKLFHQAVRLWTILQSSLNIGW